MRPAVDGQQGFDVRLIYIRIDGVEQSKERVNDRVKAGGHSVPEDKLAARYARSLANLEKAIRQLPSVTVYDNSSYEEPFRKIAEYRDGVVRWPPPQKDQKRY